MLRSDWKDDRTVRVIARALALKFLALPEPWLRRIIGAPTRSAEGLVLDVQAQALLWLMNAAREEDMHELPLAAARRRLDRNAAFLARHSIRGVRTTDRTVAGASGPRRARIYTPDEASGGNAPGLVFFHGGGFVLGSIESHDGVCRDLASQAGVVVASIDYRLAPEHPFPAAVDDAIAAVRWVLDSGSSIGVNPRAVAVGGDSAGGNLAAVAAAALRLAPRRPAFQLLVYPSTDATRTQPSQKSLGEGFGLTARDITWFLAHYLPQPGLATDVRVSPILARDLAGLPPAFVLTAGFDPLRDEARVYAERMREAGVDVEYVCFEGAVHGFINTGGGIRVAARALTQAAQALRRGLSHAALADDG